MNALEANDAHKTSRYDALAICASALEPFKVTSLDRPVGILQQKHNLS